MLSSSASSLADPQVPASENTDFVLAVVGDVACQPGDPVPGGRAQRGRRGQDPAREGPQPLDGLCDLGAGDPQVAVATLARLDAQAARDQLVGMLGR